MIFRGDLIVTDNETNKLQMSDDGGGGGGGERANVTTEAVAAVDDVNDAARTRSNELKSDRNETEITAATSTCDEELPASIPETKPKAEQTSESVTVAAATTTTTTTSGVSGSGNGSGNGCGCGDLVIEIPDALSEKDGIKFTIQTRTDLKEFRHSNFSVIRDHDDFVWLHARFTENDNYAGFVIPPIPPRPNFELSREKLMTLSDGEGHITESEFHQMKQELEAEYLAAFKKTVAMHEVFLTRLAQHSAFKRDVNFQVFLEYGTDLCARPKSKLEAFSGFLKSIEILDTDFLSSVKLKDFDDFFQRRKVFLHDYYSALKECGNCIDRMTEKQKDTADSYLKIANHFITLLTINPGKFDKFLSMFIDLVQNIRKADRRLACDQDLKLGDTVKYYQADTKAAKELLVRRLQLLAAYESANKALDKARYRNKPTVDVQKAEVLQTKAFERFNLISSQAKTELIDFRNRCLVAFKKSLFELAELEIKHATTKRNLYANALKLFENEQLR